MTGADDLAAGRLDVAGGERLTAEVGRVDLLARDRLDHLPQLGEGELGGQEGVGDRRVGDLRAQPGEGVVDDLGVVEGQRRQRLRGEPLHVLGALGASVLLGAHERPVDDRDDAVRARVRGVARAVEAAERVQLLEVGGVEAGGGAERVAGRLLQAAALAERTAGEGPEALVRLADAAHEREPEGQPRGLGGGCADGGSGAQREDHAGDGELQAHRTPPSGPTDSNSDGTSVRRT
ncbi:hypothetical protein C8046_05695 [Serinibacter arcticus]|uniref:Uncharacterized protein n=1 Tax=Serinibacter arcticus TaxID=1655435 RepID=A0A2U1ZTH5_9MICO|nr:hypothetical protein C8046_05695 [Serinibacter arcticus]